MSGSYFEQVVNMIKNKYIWYSIVLIAMTIGCKKPYNPTVISAANSYLVVEGVINSGADSTIIKLSKTVKLSESTTLNTESGATVTIEGEQNGAYTLQQIGSGIYAAAPLNLTANQKYRIHIKTAENKEYLSDFVEAKITPSIDNIDFQVKSNGLQINVNAHDATNNTRYYRWDYVETYDYYSDYNSGYKSNGDTVLLRDMVNDNIYHCWHTNASSSISIGSSIKLAQDVIAEAPVSFIAAPSEKLTQKYSILVKQYALTKEAYQFWENLKKNTEQLGSIFDAQPSQLVGNIHCVTNPAELVIGYISASTVTSKRVFISKAALPANLYASPNFGCKLDTFLFVHVIGPYLTVNDEDQFFNYNKSKAILAIPVQAIYSMRGDIIGHQGAKPICVDCTLRGTNKKPSFWE